MHHYYYALNYISYKYRLPCDVLYLIQYFILKYSINFIINKWINYKTIHFTNIYTLFNTLHIHYWDDTIGNIIPFYNLTDKRVGTIFKICYRFYTYSPIFNIWIINILKTAYNGILFIQDSNNNIFINNLFHIDLLYHKIYPFIYNHYHNT